MIRSLAPILFLVASLCFFLAVADEPAHKTKSDVKLKKVTWRVGDAAREALVYFPPKADSNPPLVFAFHGHGGTSEFASRRFAFHEHWPDAVCVYPQGLPTAVPIIDVEGKKPGWQKFIGDQKDRDLEFFDAMLQSMKADHKIDERRVYCSGHSNGGYFTYLLCAARADKLAAVAPMAASSSPRDVKLLKPLPLLHVAGEKDLIVRFALQERMIEYVRKLNGCDPEGKAAGKWCTEYRSDKGLTVVSFIHPGGHEIPEGALQRITEFFQAHPKK